MSGCKGCGKSSKSITPPSNVKKSSPGAGQKMQRVMTSKTGMGGSMTPISHAMSGEKQGGQRSQNVMSRRGH